MEFPSLPQINLQKAIYLYYAQVELSNKDIEEMFSEKVGSHRMQSLKKAAYAESFKQQMPIFNKLRVNTHCAFTAWGLKIEDLEHRYNKLKKLGLLD